MTPHLLALWHNAAWACTAFGLIGKGGTVVTVGKSYDWHDGEGLVVVNPRAVKKRALLPPQKGSLSILPLVWTARFGSLTFNQHGREFPLGGMNEKGLVVEVLWLNQTELASLDPKRATVNELQWIQYLLDTAATTKEAIRKARKVQIARVYAKVHYMVCDRKAQCAVIEYLNNRLVIHAGKSLVVPALTNSTYKVSLAALARSKAARGFGSLARFRRVATALRKWRRTPKAHVASAFALLDSVRMRDYSKWHVVYDVPAGKVHFRAAQQRTFSTIDTNNLDYSCRKPIVAANLNAVRRFSPYRTPQNRALLARTLNRLRIPAHYVQALWRYPTRACSCQR